MTRPRNSDNHGVTGGNPPPWIRGVNFVRAQARLSFNEPHERNFSPELRHDGVDIMVCEHTGMQTQADGFRDTKAPPIRLYPERFFPKKRSPPQRSCSVFNAEDEVFLFRYRQEVGDESGIQAGTTPNVSVSDHTQLLANAEPVGRYDRDKRNPFASRGDHPDCPGDNLRPFAFQRPDNRLRTIVAFQH